MTNEEVIAEFKASFPNCFKGMEAAQQLTKAPAAELTRLVALSLKNFTPQDLLRVEASFQAVGPARAKEIMLEVDKQFGSPRWSTPSK